MFGFGKKKTDKHVGWMSEARSTTQSSEPDELQVEPLASTSQPTPPPKAEIDKGGAETAKRPWFGKLFRTPFVSREREETEQQAPAPSIAAPEGLGQAAEGAPPVPPQTTAILAQPLAPVEDEPTPKRGMFARLRERLSKPRAQLGGGLRGLLKGRPRVDETFLEELETLLITADVGVRLTEQLMSDLRAQIKRGAIKDGEALTAALKERLRGILYAADGPVKQPAPGRPQVVLVVGVNGVGKTTTIGKLAKRLQAEGNRVMLAAGDTFRAAAIEQLQVWGERNGVPVIAQQPGADSASVIFDALQAATARGMDVLIADTAGRLHTKGHLMEELAKVVRVLKKIDPDAPHEVMLVVDATTGQNAIQQVEQFQRAVGLTGIALTKLDGTAKGGILFAIAERFKIPIRFIGVGEAIDDLRPFDPDAFIEALLG